METLIVVCLVIVIALLLHDKIVLKKNTEKKALEDYPMLDLPDIMGLPKPIKRLSVPSDALAGQIKKGEDETNNFGTGIDTKGFDTQIPQEELDEVFGEVSDLDAEEEEEEWLRYQESDGDNGFTTGVTFEELSAVGMLLQQQGLEPSQQQAAAEIVHKIQGTELFSLLENSMDGASQKIAALLDQRLPAETDSGSSDLRKKAIEGFDIGDFV